MPTKKSAVQELPSTPDVIKAPTVKKTTKKVVDVASVVTPFDSAGSTSVASRPLVAEPVIVPSTPAVKPAIATSSSNTNRVGISLNKPAPAVKPVAPVLPTRVQAPEQLVQVSGVLELLPDSQGFIRPKFTPTSNDAYMPAQMVRQMGLRMGDLVVASVRPKREGDRYPGVVRVESVNGSPVDAARRRPLFHELVPVYAEKQVTLETESSILSTRILDLFAPIGFGQRGMIVSPPKAGKTTLLKEIAAGVAINYPNVHLMAILVGERPEEVTDMQRFIKGEVIASSFDQKPEDQTRAAEIAIERAKRLVELGKDVFVVFDSITRLARAYNLAIPTSGRTLSGGFDPVALYPSKRFFGAARKIEHGGSLTIIGTALVDTGSKMDDLIFEEFKGTGNMEAWLVRDLADRRIYPAMDIYKSGTRRDDLLLTAETQQKLTAMRRLFDAIPDKLSPSEMVIEQMSKTKTNAEFIAKFGKQMGK